VRIDLRNQQRQRLFSVQVNESDPPPRVKPPDGDGPEVYLDWDGAFDDQKHLRKCPACGCRELFVRKDFHQVTGFAIVVAAGVFSMVLFAMDEIIWALSLLAIVVLIDVLVFFLTGKRLVCYRCRSEFYETPIPRGHPGWDLAVGEKYRVAPEAEPTDAETIDTNDPPQKDAP